MAEAVKEVRKDRERSERAKLLIALIMMLLYVTLLIMASQLSNYAFISSAILFRAPMLFLWIKLAFRALAFPIYLLINTLVKLIKNRKIDIRRTLRRSVAGINGGDSLSFWIFVKKFGPPATLALALQICYTLSSANLPTAAATAVYSVTVEISYLLSWLILGQKLMLIKTVFVLISFTGVGLIGYASFVSPAATGLGQDAIYIGVACGLGAAVFLSLYQLAFKRSFPKTDLGQTSLAITVMHLLQLLAFLPVPIIVKFTGLENYNIADMPYELLLPSWIGFGTCTIFYTYGLVLSSAFFMSIAELLVLAGNSGIDPLWRGFVISTEQIVGTCLIAIAFIVMVLPDNKLSVTLRGRGTLPPTESTIELTPRQTDADAGISESNSTSLSVSDTILPVKTDLDIADVNLDGNSLDNHDCAKHNYTIDKF